MQLIWSTLFKTKWLALTNLKGNSVRVYKTQVVFNMSRYGHYTCRASIWMNCPPVYNSLSLQWKVVVKLKFSFLKELIVWPVLFLWLILVKMLLLLKAGCLNQLLSQVLLSVGNFLDRIANASMYSLRHLSFGFASSSSLWLIDWFINSRYHLSL